MRGRGMASKLCLRLLLRHHCAHSPFLSQTSGPFQPPGRIQLSWITANYIHHGPGAMLASKMEAADGLPALVVDGASEGVQKIYSDMVDILNKPMVPSIKQLHDLFQLCSNGSDLSLALDALSRLRRTRAAKCNQLNNFSRQISELVVEACIRTESPKTALVALREHNLYGLTPHLGIAHTLLKHAKDKRDAVFMILVKRTMTENSLMPTATTADIMISLCKEIGNSLMMLKVLEEFHINGIKLHPVAYDICMSHAAKTGRASSVMKIKEWKQKFDIPDTISSAFSTAKAYLVMKKPEDAAESIYKYYQDRERWDKSISLLVRVWPIEAQKRGSKDRPIPGLKQNVISMAESLLNLGCSIRVDVDGEFGKGCRPWWEWMHTDP